MFLIATKNNLIFSREFDEAILLVEAKKLLGFYARVNFDILIDDWYFDVLSEKPGGFPSGFYFNRGIDEY